MSAAPPAKVAKLTTAVKFRDEVVINPGNYGFTDDGTLRHRGEDHHQFKFVDQVSYDQLADEVLAYCQGLLDEVRSAATAFEPGVRLKEERAKGMSQRQRRDARCCSYRGPGALG